MNANDRWLPLKGIAVYVLTIIVFAVFDPSNRLQWIIIFSVAPFARILVLDRLFPKTDEIVRIGGSLFIGMIIYFIFRLVQARLG